MIHSAGPTVESVANIQICFPLRDFEKYVRMDITCENKDHVGRPSGSKHGIQAVTKKTTFSTA